MSVRNLRDGALFTPLQARYSFPSGVATMWRTTPPPDGITAVENCFVRGSKRTSVFGVTGLHVSQSAAAAD
jgi:hypothetical protein